MFRLKFDKFFLFTSIIFLLFSIYIADKLSYSIVRNKIYDSYNPESYILDEPSIQKEFYIPVKTNNLIKLHVPFFSESDNLNFRIECFYKDKNLPCHTEIFLNKNDIKYFDVSFYPSLHNLKYKEIKLCMSFSENVNLLYTDESLDSVEYKQYGVGSKKIQIFIFVVFLFGCVLFICLLILFLQKGMHPYNLYLILALLFGVVNIFVVPPLNQPDSITHYESIYNFSNIILNKKCENDYILKRVCDLNFLPDYYNEDYSVKGHTWTGDVKAFLKFFMENYSNDYDTSLVRVPKYVTVSPRLEYLQQALLMSLGRIVGFNQFLLYFFVLWGNYFLMIFIMHQAIKISGDNYLIFFFCALNPVILYVTQSITYDAIVVSLSLLVIAMAYKIFTAEVVSKKTVIISVFCALLLFPMKTIYFPISMLVFIALFDRYGYKIKINKKYILAFLLLAIILIFIILACKYIGRNSVNYSIFDFVKNPVSSFMIFLRTLFGGSEWYEFSSSILEGYGITGILPLVLVTMFSCSHRLTKKQLYIFVAVYILVSLLLFIVAFQWTDKGNMIIWGLQTRYFYPILPIFMLCLQCYAQGKIMLDKKYALFIISLCYFSKLLTFIRF